MVYCWSDWLAACHLHLWHSRLAADCQMFYGAGSVCMYDTTQKWHNGYYILISCRIDLANIIKAWTLHSISCENSTKGNRRTSGIILHMIIILFCVTNMDILIYLVSGLKIKMLTYGINDIGDLGQRGLKRMFAYIMAFLIWLYCIVLVIPELT